MWASVIAVGSVMGAPGEAFECAVQFLLAKVHAASDPFSVLWIKMAPKYWAQLRRASPGVPLMQPGTGFKLFLQWSLRRGGGMDLPQGCVNSPAPCFGCGELFKLTAYQAAISDPNILLSLTQ